MVEYRVNGVKVARGSRAVDAALPAQPSSAELEPCEVVSMRAREPR
jgi:hypothetical protein